MEFIKFIELILWLIVDITLFSFFSIFLEKGLREEEKNKFFLCVSFFFLCSGIQRFLSIIYDFFYSTLFLLFFITLLNIIASIPLLFYLESSIIRSKRVLSFTIVIMLSIYIIAFIIMGDYNKFLMYYFLTPPLVLSMGSIGLIYLLLLFKSSGEVRKTAIIIVIGMAIMIFFWWLHSRFGRSSLDPGPRIIDIISPMGYLIGLSLIALGFFKKIDPHNKESPYDDSIIILTEKLGISYYRPKDLTEQEIAFSREQFICLVCKKEMKGFHKIFTCQGCKALYCEICAQALIKIENSCWSCSIPIDTSKPVKHLKPIKPEEKKKHKI